MHREDITPLRERERVSKQSDMFHVVQGKVVITPAFTLLAASLLLFAGAYGADLSSTITAGYTTTIGDTVPTGGTLLNVTAMLADAIGNESAVFHAEGLLFKGTLTINCPTRALFAIPVLVTVANGSTWASRTTSTHFEVTGVLGGGSRVSITGGLYAVVNANPSYFMQCSSGLRVTDASVLEILGASFTYPRTFTVSETAVLNFGALVTIANGSTLAITNSVISAENVIGSAAWRCYVLYGQVSLAISNGSTLSIINTAVEVRNLGAKDDLQLSVLKAMNSIDVSSNSTISIINTNLQVHNVSVSQVLLAVLRVNNGPFNISNDSTVSISNTVIEVHNVSVAGSWQLLVLTTSILLRITDNSVLTISSTTITVHSVSATDYWLMCVINTLTISVSNSSAMTISNTNIDMHNVSAPTSGWLTALYSYNTLATGVNVSLNSSISISNTTIQMSTMYLGSSLLQLYVLFAPSTAASICAALSVQGTTITMYNMSIGNNLQARVLHASSSLALVTNSTFEISSVTIVVHTASVAASFDIIIADIHTLSGKLDISKDSSISITNVALNVYNAHVGGSNLCVVRVSSSSIVIREGCVVTLKGIMVKVRGLEVAGSSDCSMLADSASSALTNIGGIVELADVTVDGVASTWINVFAMAGTGQVHITNVSTTGTGSMVKLQQLLPTTAPSFHVCRNHVNGSLCTLSSSGTYPCALAISQHAASLCPRTQTTSPTHNSQSQSNTLTTGVSISTMGTASPSCSQSATVQASASTSAASTSTKSHVITTSLSLALVATFTTSQSRTLSRSQVSTNTNIIGTPSPGISSSHSPVSTFSMPVTSTLKPHCPLVYASPCPYTTAVTFGPHAIPNTTTTSGCGYLTMSIPYGTWSGGGSINISILLVDRLGAFYVPSTTNGATTSASSDGLVSFTHRPTYDAGLWISGGLQYVGASTRGSWSVVVDIFLLDEQFSCRLPATRVLIPLTVYLEAAPPIPDAVVVVVDTAATIGVVSPTGLVRGGMMSSLLGMMRCSQFNPDDSLSFVNNPIGWAIGASGPRYQRGSAATVLIALCVMFLGALVGMGVVTITKSEGGVGGAVDLLRLPSCALPAILLLSESGVSSAVTLVLYEASEGSDVVLGLAVLFLLVGYMMLQAVRVLGGSYRIKKVKTTNQSALQYVLDPTHEVDATDERWVRRNFYFVEGRSWPLFGVIEVAAGTLSNILEGVPLTVSSGGLCAARPACILVMSIVLFGLLLWRVPNAVRLSQVGAVVVTALMCVCSAAVLANVVSPSDGAEGAATYIGLVVSVLNSVFGLLELVALFLAVMPLTVSAFGLRSRTLDSVIERGAEDDAEDDGANAVPMLQLPQVASVTHTPILPSHQGVGFSTNTVAEEKGGFVARQLPLAATAKEEDDEAWAARVIAQVHARED